MVPRTSLYPLFSIDREEWLYLLEKLAEVAADMEPFFLKRCGMSHRNGWVAIRLCDEGNPASGESVQGRCGRGRLFVRTLALSTNMEIIPSTEFPTSTRRTSKFTGVGAPGAPSIRKRVNAMVDGYARQKRGDELAILFIPPLHATTDRRRWFFGSVEWSSVRYALGLNLRVDVEFEGIAKDGENPDALGAGYGTMFNLPHCKTEESTEMNLVVAPSAMRSPSTKMLSATAHGISRKEEDDMPEWKAEIGRIYWTHLWKQISDKEGEGESGEQKTREEEVVGRTNAGTRRIELENVTVWISLALVCAKAAATHNHSHTGTGIPPSPNLIFRN
ncbi:hypothetical protein B0H19DRAFT_1071510 [Mycena capillaripes]|nr:hypothetical protein B0H19DRAFT_1071510 [Mycena capillaripes]